jgi:hypothetical protein
MRRIAGLVAILLTAGLSTGCVERSYVIETNPPGAFVLVNNRPLGPAPVDGTFEYYGKYHFTLIKDGYETQQVEQPLPAPWFEYWPFDFFAENVWPFKIEDKRRFRYELAPAQVPNTADVIRRAEDLRTHGHGIRPATALPASPAPPPPPAEIPPPLPPAGAP